MRNKAKRTKSAPLLMDKNISIVGAPPGAIVVCLDAMPQLIHPLKRQFHSRNKASQTGLPFSTTLLPPTLSSHTLTDTSPENFILFPILSSYFHDDADQLIFFLFGPCACWSSFSNNMMVDEVEQTCSSRLSFRNMISISIAAVHGHSANALAYTFPSWPML